MGGPIVRTGATPEFWENWDKIFGDTGKKKSGAKASSPSSKKASKRAAKKSAGKK
jgi:hypothetical protein|tara:strand:- start:530 stop:694 length:165 start_codon:yes stop_codon:yes gene_type:complete